jgi:histidinol-phosphate/aromatic aminotransferase/cobyric acid decarboxylase-like protein
VGDATGFAAALLAHGVAVRSHAGWGHPDAIRVTVGTNAENNTFLAALDAITSRLPRAA